MSYQIFELSVSDSFFLGELSKLLDPASTISYFVPSETKKVTRRTFDGFYTFVGKINNTDVGIIYNDFRSFGSSIGVSNSHRVGSFIDYLNEKSIPLIYLSDSIGVRVQDGRAVFRNTFSLIEKINRFVENNLYITISLGHTLGLSAILYSIGDYRISLDDAVFNLTGPEVFRMFFGTKVDFKESCDASRMVEKNNLVHHRFSSKEQIWSFLKQLLQNKQQKKCNKSFSSLEELYHYFSNNELRLFVEKGKSLDSSILKTEKGDVGLLRNPLNKGNLMTVNDIVKFRESLNLFKKLSLPFVNLVDCPGGDPRIENNDLNISRFIYDLAVEIIRYPYYKRGIVVGRCFGGSSILSIPVFYGGEKTLALKESYIGIMGKKIIEQLLSASPPLLETWKKNSVKEREDYGDFIDEGIVDKVIEVKDIYPEMIKSI